MTYAIRSIVLTLFGLLVPFAAAQAGGEDALYAAQAPDGAAFVRVVNADTRGKVSDITIGDKTIKEVEPLEASPYIFQMKGDYPVNVAGHTRTIHLAPNQYYTLVLTDSGELKVLKDKTFDNPRKALISFYNLTTESSLALKTSDGKVAVIKSVPPMQAKNREINAVKIALASFSNDQVLAKTDPVNLQRGKVFSVFAINVGGSPRLVVTENRVDTSV